MKPIAIDTQIGRLFARLTVPLRLPVVEEIPYGDAYRKFLDLPDKEGTVFLDGAEDHEDTGRYSVLLCNPLFTVSFSDGLATVSSCEGTVVLRSTLQELTSALEPLLAMRPKDTCSPVADGSPSDQVTSPQPSPSGQSPRRGGRNALHQAHLAMGGTSLGGFDGGLVMLLSYELNHCYEKRPTLLKNGGDTPDLWAAFYPDCDLYDNKQEKAWRVTRSAQPAPVECQPGTAGRAGYHLGAFACDESRESFRRKIQKVRQYIHEGDVYQVNLSRRLEAPFLGDPRELYGVMRRENPSAYGACLNGSDFWLLSMSPEMFFRLEDGFLETRPIKGTAPRGHTPQADEVNKTLLRLSEKDRAENVMIVDLMRNDISKVCKPGSVAVPALCATQTLPTVHHLVSTVTGIPKEKVTLGDLLSALFPAGSITGAPKIRAMEIIAEYETSPRGFYCGSLLAAGCNGNISASVLIRTLTISGGRAVYRTGGGITADSNPESEFEETEHKAAVLEKLRREL